MPSKKRTFEYAVLALALGAGITFSVLSVPGLLRAYYQASYYFQSSYYTQSYYQSAYSGGAVVDYSSGGTKTISQTLTSPLGTWQYRARCGGTGGLSSWVTMNHQLAQDVCSDISGQQSAAPPGCQTPSSSPGACIPPGGSWNGLSCVTNDVCSDIPSNQPIPPPGCQEPSPSPGACVPPGYVWDGSQCAAPTIQSFTASPLLVRAGNPATLTWNIVNPPESCTITGDNGFFAPVTEASGSLFSNSITTRTVFTLDCAGVQRQAVVNLIPIYQEI